VLLIALAAARPFARAGGDAHAPTAVAIVLDNGLSTGVVEGDDRVIDALKARALELLAAAGPDDRFWLIRAGEPAMPALPGDAETTALRVRETEPAPTAVDLVASLERAAGVLAAGADGRAPEIHLLSDLRAAAFGTPLAAGDAAPPVVVWHPGTPAPPNRGITGIEAGGGMAPIAGDRITLAVNIEGVGEETPVRVIVDGELVAAATAPPGSGAVVTLPPRPAGVLAGRAEIDADALRADDVRHFAFPVLPPPRVATSAALPFVDEALSVLAQSGRISRTGRAAATVVITDAGSEVATGGAGRSLVVLPPADRTALAAANRRLAAAGIPWRYADAPAGEARFAVSGDAALDRALGAVRLRTAYPLTPITPSADSVLLRLDDATRWAVRGARDDGSVYVLLASPFTEDASTLPASAAMLPLLDRAVSAWALALAPHTDLAPGARITLPAEATAVERPDGTRDAVAAGAAFPLGIVPGVYRVLRGDSAVAAYAVNAPAAASDLRRLGDAIAAYLPGWSLHVHAEPAAYRRAAYRERLGRELWRPLLIALLALLAMETLIAAGRSRPAEPATLTPEPRTS
jgi:hypothetical protein